MFMRKILRLSDHECMLLYRDEKPSDYTTKVLCHSDWRGPYLPFENHSKLKFVCNGTAIFEHVFMIDPTGKATTGVDHDEPNPAKYVVKETTVRIFLTAPLKGRKEFEGHLNNDGVLVFEKPLGKFYGYTESSCAH